METKVDQVAMEEEVVQQEVEECTLSIMMGHRRTQVHVIMQDVKQGKEIKIEMQQDHSSERSVVVEYALGENDRTFESH